MAPNTTPVIKPATQQKTSMTQSDHDLRRKFISYLMAVRQIVIGRDKETTVLGVAVLAKANVMLLGRPGEGKSFLASTFMNNIKHGTTSDSRIKTFFTACSPETDMDAIFGTPIFADLQEGRVRRNTENTLADAHFAFIDISAD